MEGFPRSAAARANDQRGSGDAEVLESFGGRVFALVRRERLRRLRAALVFDEKRAATSAVVRSFGILEAALLTVDVAHLCGRCGLRGQDLGQVLDVHVVEDARPSGLLKPSD